MRARWLLAPLTCLLLAGPALRAEEEPGSEISDRELKGWVRRLADDELKGREAGTPECDRAAEWIAQEFARLGLKPLGTDGTWFQPFTSPLGMRVLPTSAMAATDEKGARSEFKVGEDFSPADVSAPGAVTGTVAFAGYGVVAPAHSYDDYADLDVKGKVVVVLRGAPRYYDARKSPFGDVNALAQYASFKAKADLAAERGALALVVVNDPQSHARPDDDVLRPPGGSTTGRIPVVHVTWRAGRKLGSSLGLSLQRLQRVIDSKLSPASEVLASVTLEVRCDIEPEERQMKNVAGLLEPDGAQTTGEGAPPVSSETLVIGAHYDHVGLGRFGSLANADGEIHNGADDNASGTSAMLEIAGWLAARRADLKRRVLFLAFSGEELGLLGSKHYVRAPLIPNADVVAMLNLDMVGRSEKNRLFIGGVGTSPVWPEMIERLNKETRFDVVSWPGGKAPSDHASFYEADLPVLFFFTGLHGDYHRPSDDYKTINYAGQEKVARLAALIALETANLSQRPQFTRCDAGGFEVGPYTGIAVEQRDGGLYVAHVDKRSPGQQAGVKEGDRITSLNGEAIPDSTRWNDLVSKARPSEKMELELERDGKRRRVRLKLGST